MAVDTAMNAGRRRLMFGANVLFSIVLAVGVLITAVYLAGQYKMQFDWTSSGANSLSPRTVKLIKRIDQDITVTALYTVLTEYSLAQKRQDRVRDLLDLYESVGGAHIAASVLDPMKDQSRLTPILERLKNKSIYKDEAAPHDEVLQSLPKLVEDLQVLLQGEIDQMGGIDPEFQGDKFTVIQRNLQIIQAEAREESEGIMSLLTGELPEYGRAIQELTTYLPRVRTVLEDARAWATSVAATNAQMPAAALSFYGEAGNRYAGMLDRIADMMERSKDLKKVALEKIYADLRNWTRSPVILVETESEARVLSMQDVWPQRRDPNAPMPEDGDTREFAGEQALSSALLQLTQKEKTAVIFTYWGGPSPLSPDFSQMNPMMMNLRQMPTAPYQRVNTILQDANFVTDEWDVQKAKQPPIVEGATRVIYIVFRPTVAQPAAPNQPPPPGISPADKKIILDAVTESGLALFLTGWVRPTGPMQFIPGGNQYEYADYLAEQWGVNVRSDLVTIAFQPIPGQPGLSQPRNRDPFALVTNTIPEQLRYSDHEIVQPLRTLDSFFQDVAPLEILSGEKAVKDVHVAAVVEVAPSTDIWAIADVMAVNRDFQRTPRGTKPRPADLLAAPSGFPIVVAAEKTGDGKTGRVLVASSENFATDAISFRRGVVQVGNGFRMIAANPGNIELLLNGLHWLAGNADRISIGPASSDVPRLAKLEEGGVATFCRVFLVGLWPGLMLLAGGGVWLVRRR